MIANIAAVVLPVLFGVVVWLTCTHGAPKIPPEIWIPVAFSVLLVAAGFVAQERGRTARAERNRVEIQNPNPWPIYVAAAPPRTMTISTISAELPWRGLEVTIGSACFDTRTQYASAVVTVWQR